MTHQQKCEQEVKEYKAFLEEKDRKVAELTKNNKMKEQITPEQEKAMSAYLNSKVYHCDDCAHSGMMEVLTNPSKYGLSTPAPSEKQMQRTIDEQYKTIEGSKGLSEQEIREEDCPECGGSGIANRYRY